MASDVPDDSWQYYLQQVPITEIYAHRGEIYYVPSFRTVRIPIDSILRPEAPVFIPSNVQQIHNLATMMQIPPTSTLNPDAREFVPRQENTTYAEPANANSDTPASEKDDIKPDAEIAPGHETEILMKHGDALNNDAVNKKGDAGENKELKNVDADEKREGDKNIGGGDDDKSTEVVDKEKTKEDEEKMGDRENVKDETKIEEEMKDQAEKIVEDEKTNDDERKVVDGNKVVDKTKLRVEKDGDEKSVKQENVDGEKKVAEEEYEKIVEVKDTDGEPKQKKKSGDVIPEKAKRKKKIGCWCWLECFRKRRKEKNK